ncbi:MAG: hypothetical protein QOC98_690, partial [Frankiaceae bacterium]|nr:hypothetical protein [Frankiaceae bacterium]
MAANGHRTRIRALLGLTVASSVVSAVLVAPIAMAAPAPSGPRVAHA